MEDRDLKKWFFNDLQDEAQHRIRHAYTNDWTAATHFVMSETIPSYVESKENVKERIGELKDTLRKI